MLNQYHVELTYIAMKHLLKEMSIAAAAGVKRQCGREYFPDDERKPRATQLYKMKPDESKNIPTRIWLQNAI